jgi:hypothetical protein
MIFALFFGLCFIESKAADINFHSQIHTQSPANQTASHAQMAEAELIKSILIN